MKQVPYLVKQVPYIYIMVKQVPYLGGQKSSYYVQLIIQVCFEGFGCKLPSWDHITYFYQGVSIIYLWDLTTTYGVSGQHFPQINNKFRHNLRPKKYFSLSIKAMHRVMGFLVRREGARSNLLQRGVGCLLQGPGYGGVCRWRPGAL